MNRRSAPHPGMLVSVLLVALCCVGVARAAVVTVEIEGVEGAALDNVRAFLGIVQYEFDPDDPGDARIVRRLHQRAPEEIRRALEPFGYYESNVDARLERDDEGNWRAQYRVRPGPEVRLTEVTLRVDGEGAEDPAFTAVLDELSLAEGQRLEHEQYENAKAHLMGLASDRGYLEARWSRNVLRVDPAAREATAILILDTGPRYRFGRTEFEDTVLGEEFLRRYLRFRPGDPFESDKLLDLQYALDDSDYFSFVDVRARRDKAADGRIPVEVKLEARPKHRYTFGIGFGTDTGPRVSVGRETRYLNDRGHSLKTEVQIAEISTRVSARYTIPLEEPWRERLEFDTSYGEEDVGDAESQVFDVGGKFITTSGGWQRSQSLRFERSRDRISGDTTTRDLVMPGIGFGRSSFDNSIYASRGYRLSLDLNGGTETFGSDVSFARAVGSVMGVHRLWKDARVLGRLQLGRVWIDDIDELPLSQRFFAGGDQSVRGFDFQALGPRNETGDVVGGQYLAVSSVELEQLIVGNWGAAVFADHGNAMNDLDTPLRTSAGVGLRYRSPVGMFRVDVARTTDGEESARLHLSLGVNL